MLKNKLLGWFRTSWMLDKDLPTWFRAWQILNAVLAISFVIYWISIDFETNTITLAFIIYSGLGTLLMGKYLKKRKIIS